MKSMLLLLIAGCTMTLHTVTAQTLTLTPKVITTGNNLINTADPGAADMVIGSNLNGGARHDGSIMWFSNASASRISNTADVFYLSQWNTTIPNIGLAAIVRGSSYLMGNVGIGTTNPQAKLEIFGNAVNTNNLILSADYSNGYRWRFNTIDRGNAIDMDITASGSTDAQESILKLSPTFSGRPSLILQDNWLVARDGNISIGTADAKGYKLAVNGSVVATSITVKPASAWP